MRGNNKWSGRILCAVLIAALLCTGIRAAGGTLTVNYSQNGVTFRVYQVAVRQDDLTWKATAEFEDFQVDLDSDDPRGTAAILAGYVARDGLQATASAKTQQGAAVFSGLEYGLYLVVGERSSSGGHTDTPVPFLVEVTGSSLSVNAKFDREDEPDPSDTTSITVKKVWAGSGNHPVSVTVQLLKNGSVYKETALNALNGWSHTWRDLDNSARWQVVEKEVPDGYTVSVSQEGNTFTVTNTLKATPPDEPDKPDEPDVPDTPDTPDIPDQPDVPDTPPQPDVPDQPDTPAEPGLPQTGQLWWPVAALACGGVALIAFGWVRRRRDTHDE